MSIASATDTAPLLELSAERDQWQRVALARERAAGDRRYREGYADGYREGYAARYAELEAAWHAVSRHVATSDPRSFAELERARRGDAA